LDAADQYRHACADPETYAQDLNVRLGLYRRLADLATDQEIEAFAAELIDRFGPLPVEAENLLRWWR